MKRQSMNNPKYQIAEDWIDQASNKQREADKYLRTNTQYLEAIQSSQESIELNIKAILLLLNISFPPSHEWKPDSKDFKSIAHQIQERQLNQKLDDLNLLISIPLPKLLFIFNFWGQFYPIAKYGFEVEYLASAKNIFSIEEAKIAVYHSQQCMAAANTIRYLEKDKFLILNSQ